MREIKLWVETGFCGACHEETIKVDDDCTNEELDELAKEFLYESISYGWEEL